MTARTSLAALALVVVTLFLTMGGSMPVSASAPTKTVRFVDNGDGTVTDNQTGLMWEKKTDSNVNDLYSWTSATFGTAADGTLFTTFLATMQCTLSANGTCGLAGHYDWRIPNIGELQTIVDCSKPNCVDPAFGPTNQTSPYWSATTGAADPTGAWFVSFITGDVSGSIKAAARAARAVRGGR
jgi:hypothetical protein